MLAQVCVCVCVCVCVWCVCVCVCRASGRLHLGTAVAAILHSTDGCLRLDFNGFTGNVRACVRVLPVRMHRCMCWCVHTYVSTLLQCTCLRYMVRQIFGR